MFKKILIPIALLLIWSPLSSQLDWPYDFTRGSIALHIKPLDKEILGQVSYRFTTTKEIDSLFLDARKMSFDEVRFNGKLVNFVYDGRKLVIRKHLKPNKRYRLDISYKAKPKQAVYFLGWQDSIRGNEQVWTQGQGKYSSHWVPSPDEMSEKIIFNITLTFDPAYEVIANGKLWKVKEEKDKKVWQYRMELPMSSYLLAFSIGRYTYMETESISGIPMHLYAYPEDQFKMEPTYRYSEQIFNFLEAEIGVPYPWQNYKQVPVRDFLYAGMENTGTTLFSDAYVVDSLAFRDLNYVNVNAHELAHQWFGNLATETDAAQHWLHEGLATYYSYLSEKQIFGDDYFYWRLWDTTQQLKQQQESGAGESLINPKASSLTFYEKGAWAALMLSEQIGKDNFKAGIRKFLDQFAYKNATLSQFISIMETACDCSLNDFYSVWFASQDLPYKACEDYLLRNSKSIRLYRELQRELTVNSATNESIIAKQWVNMDSQELKSRIIFRYAKSLSEKFLLETAKESSLKVRQAIARSLSVVSPEMQETFETFLEDPSYITRENALYKLWISFPQKRATYLDSTQDQYGLPNRSLRMTWLLLALLTPDYGNSSYKASWESELRGYTAPIHNFEIRQNAFAIINEVLDLDDQNLKHLAQACTHHVWQFRKFARNLMEELLKAPAKRERIIALIDEMEPEQQDLLKKIFAL